MRVRVIATGKFPIPDEQLMTLVRGFTERRQQYRSQMSEFFFAGREGGGGVLDVVDGMELHQIMLDWSFAPYCDIQVMPIIDGDVGLDRFEKAVAKMAAAMPHN